MKQPDPLSRVLYIDLTSKRFWVRQRDDLFSRYLGGSGVATQLLLEECPPGCDPLGADNPIILAVGPLTGLYPLASKTIAMFKSPHTHNLGESHCGGRSAISIRLAGYGAIVIKGASRLPLYIAIHGNEVYFRNAASIWGLENSFTVGRVLRDNEPGSGLRSIMRIGAAGEKLVTYSSVVTESYRHFGRLGLGAVFGSKKIKGIVISGKHSLPVSDIKAYRQSYDEIYQTAVTSPLMKKYHDLGTAENVLPLNSLNGFPTMNLTSTQFKEAANISGEAFAERYLGRRLACSHCPVGCIHIAALREPYADEAYFYKTDMICYDYEPIYSLGSMLGIGDATAFLKLMEQIEIFCIDAMSTGVVLAWATEAQQHKLISTEHTLGLELKWGDAGTYMKALRLIINQPNQFYQALAKGVEYASSIYGGREFALSFGGNEMPGYHTGAAAHVGVVAGTRHSHLDNAGYSLDQKALSKGQNLTPQEMAESLVAEERWRQVLSSLVVCFFARGIYTPEKVISTLKSAGFFLSLHHLDAIGREIYQAKYRFKMQEGFSLDNLKLPSRIYETPSSSGKIDPDYVRACLTHIKKIIQE